MNGCLEKIQVSQKLIQSFLKNFLDNSNVYDMYHFGIWFRSLSSQIYPVFQLKTTFDKLKINPPLIKEITSNSVIYKLGLKRKDWEDFVKWKIKLPIWLSYFSFPDNPFIGKWLYQCFRYRMSSTLNSIFSSIFTQISSLHRIRIVDEMSTVTNWTSRFNSQSLMDKISEVLDFSHENSNRLNPENHIFLIKRRVAKQSILRGYICRIDSLILNFTTNRLIGSELVKHFSS